MIDITEERYKELLDIEHKMMCLEAAGIDNTEAYSEGMIQYRVEVGEDDDVT